jgi:hypothetical protein
MKTIFLLQLVAASTSPISTTSYNLIFYTGCFAVQALFCVLIYFCAKSKKRPKLADFNLSYFETALPKFDTSKSLTLELGLKEEDTKLSFEGLNFESLDRMISNELQVPAPLTRRTSVAVLPAPRCDLPALPDRK